MKITYKTVELLIEEAYQFVDANGSHYEGGNNTICRVTTPYGKCFARTQSEALRCAREMVDGRIQKN